MTKSDISAAFSLVLVLIAASSLLSMIGLIQIDGIINRDLYNYGLEFSYAWAMPYWTMTAIVFGMGWFNIIAAVALQLYILLSRKAEAPAVQPEVEALKIEAPSVPQPAESKKEEIEKAEEVEKPKETPAPAPAVETEQKPEEKKEEAPITVEQTSQSEPSEEKPPLEEQKEQEAKPTEGAEPKPEEKPAPAMETQPKTQEKSEEAPILVGVPEE